MSSNPNSSPFMDWDQVVANGGPPCFHVERNTPDERPRYCARAERWQGHGVTGFHPYVSLDDLLGLLETTEPDELLGEFMCHATYRPNDPQNAINFKNLGAKQKARVRELFLVLTVLIQEDSDVSK